MAMGVGGAAGDDDDVSAPMSDMNVTPMVDVMLVLLIVFMVAAPMMMVGVPVQLPPHLRGTGRAYGNPGRGDGWPRMTGSSWGGMS